jgi:AcrR family transcriptional regulator
MAGTAKARGRPRKTYHHGDLRAALIAAARRIVEREGPEAASLRQVARGAGVSQAAPYHHFADKEALLAAVAEQGFAELTEAMTARARAAASDKARFDATGVGYVCFAADNPGLFRLMFSASAFALFRGQAAGTEALRAYAVLETGVRRSLPPDAPDRDVALAALRAWSVVHGLAKLLVETGIAPADYGAKDVAALAGLVLARPRGPAA